MSQYSSPFFWNTVVFSSNDSGSRIRNPQSAQQKCSYKKLKIELFCSFFWRLNNIPNIFFTKDIPYFTMNTLCQKFPPAFTAAPLICELQLEHTSRSFLMAYFCIVIKIDVVRMGKNLLQRMITRKPTIALEGSVSKIN